MSIVFFGQGMANGFDMLMADTAPTEAFGTETVGVCQMCANIGGALTPLLVGFIIQATGSYAGGIAYVSACAILGVVSVGFIIKKVDASSSSSRRRRFAIRRRVARPGSSLPGEKGPLATSSANANFGRLCAHKRRHEGRIPPDCDRPLLG